MVSTRQGITLIVAILLIALLSAFLLPIALNNLNADNTLSVNQTEATTVQLGSQLNATLDAVDDGTNTINVTVTDINAGTSDSATNIAQGANATVTVEGETITINNDEVHDATHATITYEWSKTYGWSTGETALFGLLGIFFILGIVLFVVKMSSET